MSIFKKIVKAVKSLFSSSSSKNKTLIPFQNHLWNFDRFDDVKSKSYKINYINKTASEYETKADLTVVNKRALWISDPHYMVTLAPYYWPNPDTEDGLPYIVRDCERNPELEMYDAPIVNGLVSKMTMLSIAFHVTDNEKYYNMVVNQLKTFFIEEDTRMYPDFSYCQVAPGYNSNMGLSSLEAYNFIAVFESVLLVHSTKEIPQDIIKALKEWAKKSITSLETSYAGKHELNMKNNHGVMYDVLLIYLKVFSEGKMDETSLKRLKGRIDEQIKSDGTQPLELERPSGLHYSVYNLTHMVDAYRMLKSVGKPLEEKYVAKIKKAFEFLLSSKTLADFKALGYNETSDWDKEYKVLNMEAARMGLVDFDFLSSVYYYIK